MSNALVLLGFSGSGKDTLANHIIKQYLPEATNVKFAYVSKELVGRAFGQDHVSFEDNVWRAKTEFLGITPLDFVNAVFKGLKECPELAAKFHKVAIAKAKESSFPIFTDIRREEELKAVQDAYDPYVVYLLRPGQEKSLPDEDVLKLAEENANLFCKINILTDSVDYIANVINDSASLWSVKPTVHVYKVGASIPKSIAKLPVYYHLEFLRNRVVDFLGYNSDFSVIQKVVQTIVEENGNFDYTPITEDCLFIWFPSMGTKVLDYIKANSFAVGQIDELY